MVDVRQADVTDVAGVCFGVESFGVFLEIGITLSTAISSLAVSRIGLTETAIHFIVIITDLALALVSSYKLLTVGSLADVGFFGRLVELVALKTDASVQVRELATLINFADVLIYKPSCGGFFDELVSAVATVVNFQVLKSTLVHLGSTSDSDFKDLVPDLTTLAGVGACVQVLRLVDTLSNLTPLRVLLTCNYREFFIRDSLTSIVVNTSSTSTVGVVDGFAVRKCTLSVY